MNRSKKSAARIRRLLVICSLMTVIIAASTYAWFVGMKTVNVSSFDVEIESTESLLLSLNGVDWEDTVNISESTFDSSSYVGNTNKWAGEGLIPMSSIGAMDSGASRMMLYEKASLTATPGGYRLMASRVDNYSSPTADEPDGYVVFDLFIKNYSGAQYLENLNILDEEAIYLTPDSVVTVAESGVANTGIENSVRVAFAQIGRVKGTSTDAAKIAGLSCAPTVGTGVTGICRSYIWEPNETKHEENAISWYDASCLSRTGADVIDEDNYSGPCETVSDGTAYPTYAINDDILLTDNVNIYDGDEYNGYTPSAKMGVADTFTDTEKLKTLTNRPSFMMLAPNSITKVRVYIYIEGQDIDNYDFASIGKAISVNFGFTKERFDQGSLTSEEDTSPVLAAESCFDFSGGTISGYYYNEGDDDQNPSCPRNLIIPETINSEAVTTIGDSAFGWVDLTSVEIPDTITSIGPWAFADNYLTSINIPDSVTMIDEYAFYSNELTSVSIPTSVTYLGEASFIYNNLPDNEAYIYERTDTNSDDIAEMDTTAVNSYAGARTDNVQIPDGVVSLSASSFNECGINSIEIPDSVTTIGEYALSGNNLTTLDMPNSVTSVARGAFYGNDLTSVTISTGMTTIPDSAFWMNNLTSIVIPDNITIIEGSAFSYNQLESITIPSSVTTIGETAFRNNQLESITIPNSVTSLGLSVFVNNQLPDAQAFIYERTDTNNDDIAEIDTTTINSYAGAKRTNVIIPNGVLMLSQRSFSYNSLTSVTVPESLVAIDAAAFMNNSLTSITIPNSVEYINSSAFAYNQLTSVCIKNKATSANFTLYGFGVWGWADGYSDSNITWNCTN